jgi:hypothetical protein
MDLPANFEKFKLPVSKLSSLIKRKKVRKEAFSQVYIKQSGSRPIKS